MAAERYAFVRTTSSHSFAGMSNIATIPSSPPSGTSSNGLRVTTETLPSSGYPTTSGMGTVETASTRAGVPVGFVNVCKPSIPRGQKTTSPGASGSSPSPVRNVGVPLLMHGRAELLRTERHSEETRTDAHLLGGHVPRLIREDVEAVHAALGGSSSGSSSSARGSSHAT